ncbi:MAG: saccharopine dehydrogenase NADP-binding domain-containing protein [Kangiellaceae bacterium]|nr:saccharopine dehydrogenase NADP-binding domain-containing protein [Kangiellaceae bacterium]
MAKFLVFGAGFVAQPLVEYLTRREDNQVTVASHILQEAELLAQKFEQAKAVQVDVTNQQEVEQLVDGHDLVISLVPAPLHPTIAKAAITKAKNMVTASYESAEMKALNEQAQAAGVTILNEIGLDPGIDHLSAMQIIDQAHAKGEKVRTFVSWCGGLPAPEDNDNPLGYKFSWAPKGVLMALLNEAVFLKNGEVEKVDAAQLLAWAKPLDIAGLSLEGYPNRESTSYQVSYGIPEAHNILRGTLRYAGFCDIIQAAKQLKLLSVVDANSADLTWSQYIEKINGLSVEQLSQHVDGNIWSGLEWIGCFSDQFVGCFSNPLDAFCHLLTQKLVYQSNERDMVILQHKFALERADGSQYYIASTLKALGEVGGYTAMSKTVGYPAAIAAQLIADKKIDRKGVILPVSADIYQPILQQLEKEGISCVEQQFEVKDGFLSELE